MKFREMLDIAVKILIEPLKSQFSNILNNRPRTRRE